MTSINTQYATRCVLLCISSCQSLINPVSLMPYIFFASFASLATFALNIFKPNFSSCHHVKINATRHTLHAILFMENKPNLPNAKMNLNYYTKSNYKEKRLCRGRKNKPKQTQIFLPSGLSVIALAKMEALAKEGQTHRKDGYVFTLD